MQKNEEIVGSCAFIPWGIFPRGLEPEGPGWEMCVSALRVFAGAVVTVTVSEVA